MPGRGGWLLPGWRSSPGRSGRRQHGGRASPAQDRFPSLGRVLRRRSARPGGRIPRRPGLGRGRAGAEWPRQRTTRMVRPIVPGAFSMAQNAHFGDSIGHRGIRWATDHIGIGYLKSPAKSASGQRVCGGDMSPPNGTCKTRNNKSGSEKGQSQVTWVTSLPVRRRHRCR